MRKRTAFQAVTIAFYLCTASAQPIQAADGPDCPPLPAHLSDQTHEPFLFRGEPMDGAHPQWKRYRRKLEDFATVRDCLLPEEAAKPAPDLRRFDWDRVGTGAGARICVFRVARSLGEPDAIFNWLSAQGFAFDRKLVPFKGANYKPRSSLEPVYNISASWSTQQYRSKNPSLLASLFGIELVTGYSLVLNLSQNCEVVGVGTTANSE